MAWYDSLIEQGAVPAGTKPKMVNPATGKAEYGSSSTLETMIKSLSDVMAQQREQQEKRREAMKKQVDMYNTLRDQGYDPKAASEAVRTMQFPTSEPGVPLKDQKTQAEIDEIRHKIGKPDLTGNKQYEISVQKANALATIKGKHYGSRKMAERALLEQYKDISLDDVDIRGALEDAYPPEPEPAAKKKWFDFSKKGAVKQGKLKSGMGYKVVK